MPLSYCAPFMAALVLTFTAPLRVDAQPPEPQPDSTPPKHVALRGTVVVPLVDPGIPNTTVPVVEVMVNGRGPFRFGVETGANFVALSPDFAAKANLRSAGTTADLPAFRIDSITLGGASFHDVRAAALPRGGTGVDGLLGLPFFHDVLLTIDYAARQLRISRDTLRAPDGDSILQLTHAGPFWGVPIDFAGVPLVGVLDTRGTGMLSVIPDVATRLRFEGDLKVIGRARGAAIPDVEVKAGQLDGSVQLGGYSFPRPMISIRPLPPGFPTGPIIGDNVLRNFVVSLDQRHGRLRLERAGSRSIELSRPVPNAATAAHGAPPGVDSLAGYVGEYGDREITLTAGKLYLQRPGGPQLEMRQTGRDAFGLVAVAEARIEFTRDGSGKVNAIRVFRSGAWEEVPRSK